MRGNVVMKGYYNDPQATQAAIRGGWFHSGDAAVVHSDGYVEIRDRFKDVIISGGENVSSVEIDANPGYDVAIYVADESGRTLADWGSPRVTRTDVPANAQVELSPSAGGRFVLVWFTLLPESRRLDVSEIRVL